MYEKLNYCINFKKSTIILVEILKMADKHIKNQITCMNEKLNYCINFKNSTIILV